MWYKDLPGSAYVCVSTGNRVSNVGYDFNDEASVMRVYHSATVC